MTLSLNPTAARAVSAYGGEPLWRNAGAVEADIVCGGLLFRWKRLTRIPAMHVRAEIGEPVVRLEPIDRAGNVGILHGPDVRIERPDGSTRRIRTQARQAFPYGRRLFHWDNADFTYFLGYALWNYLTLPSLLLRTDIEWREDGQATLEATFPAHLPTHSARQRFHFDPATGFLGRLDYTAEVFGGWAHAAHFVTGYQDFGGIPFATRRRVQPRVGARPLSGPALIWAEISNPKIVQAA